MVDGTTVAKGDGKGQAGLALGVESVAGRDTRGDAPPSVGKVLESAGPRAHNKRPLCYRQRTGEAPYTFQAGFLIIRAYARGSLTTFLCRIRATK